MNPEIDHSAWEVTVVPDLGELGNRIQAAREATAAAATAQEEAARFLCERVDPAP